jgi:hypothetical protein
MGNTLTNKARFFALYTGQRIFYSKHYEGAFELSNYPATTLWKDETIYAKLKPLSSITDEDNKVVSKIMQETDFLDSDYSALHTADYLRSKGYALPFLGLSVEKLIEYNWIKLI